MNSNLYALIGLGVATSFIMALKGLSAPKTARRGNLIGAFGATVATVVVFFDPAIENGHNTLLIIGAIAFGVVVGVPAARKIQMTQMPQLVALFNGVGGGAAALVAIVEYLNLGDSASFGEVLATVFTVLVGSVSFSGSIITFLKLQELMTTRPVVFPGGRFVIAATLVGALGTSGWVIASGGTTPLLVLAALSLLFGVLFVLPVGGADVPIVISLLNAFTGLTVAASGYVLQSTLLIVAGTLVGASGTILTRKMAEAMGRSLFGTLFGAFTAKPQAASEAGEARTVKSGSADDVAILLNYAQRVVIVPGFGLAVAQAQHTVRELADLLAAKGVEVAYGIHPVAGRMPGHMNVLLAEANVPYEQLVEMEEINPTFPQTDVVLVVGANDVVNPAAKTTPGCPIYGMPILDVASAGNVIFLKRSMRPGFAGIENELLYDTKTTLLFGDAKDSLTKVVSALKNL
ncbi:MAG: NAD(P)(+) transhydrogenase (Re/Si-specific) subunit beta [SAR202 cluster bacterium]|jgi:H+-translocating NAD(P) transhydrogenase subunit beta|nr:NAD(P)(+) transhydrogenase (Re/Si-specific) subunit beta [SAR202 cluster bacterium]|tara:strand:- start:8744 stop:10126 length:1383 start_codon:yes stop_codon:yes gene_type:complete